MRGRHQSVPDDTAVVFVSPRGWWEVAHRRTVAWIITDGGRRCLVPGRPAGRDRPTNRLTRPLDQTDRRSVDEAQWGGTKRTGSDAVLFYAASSSTNILSYDDTIIYVKKRSQFNSVGGVRHQNGG